MNATQNADGTVTVTAAGHYRMSELLDAAALEFAAARETAVDWPTLVGTRELGPDSFLATFALEV
jgi:hypothetical protein